MSELAEDIRLAREGRGWDQSELVRQLSAVGVKVSQQTISRWERGRTRPTGDRLDALVGLLDLMRFEGGISSTENPSAENWTPPSRPALLTRLPFDQLSPETFEDFAADLASHWFPDGRAHRVGHQGHKQDGIDVAVEHASGLVIGIQCKREKDFGPAKIKKAVRALHTRVARCLIFLSRTASPGARREIRTHEGWELWDADDLSRAVRLLEKDKALRIVDTFFPGLRESFLGVATTGPWQDADAFFAPFTSDRVFTHRHSLVGQKGTLDDLVATVLSGSNSVTRFSGRGGQGKTRLLREVAGRVQGAGIDVRFLATGASVSPADPELLPQGDVLLIIDDAHDCPNLRGILTTVVQLRPGARILLALRPYGQGRCLDALRLIGLHESEAPLVELPDLSVLAAEELATTVLPEDARHLAPLLGGLGTDCPLLVVLGAELVRRGRLDAPTFASSPALADEILSRFAAATVGDGSTPPSEFRMEVLRALAVLQPLRTDVEDFQEAISTLTGRSYDQVVGELGRLEDSGVVLRRGAALRIVPDLLGDALLKKALIDPGGRSTGYVQRVHAAVQGSAFDNALRNATRADWLTGPIRHARTDLVEPLWAVLEADFKQAGIAGRQQLAASVREVAQFQPARTLTLIAWAADNPTLQDDDAVLWGGPPDHGRVLQQLAPALAGVCASPDHIAAAADLLWRLGRGDPRPLHQHPNHPVRLLSDLAEFQQHKPTWVTTAMIDRVAVWLEDPETSDDSYSPLEVLRPVLATEGHRQHWDGYTVSFTPHGLNASGVAAFRRRVLDLAFAQLRHSDVRQAARALDVIGDGLRFPIGGWGRTPSDKEHEAWLPVILEALVGLRRAVSDRPLDPAVEVGARTALCVSYPSSRWRTAAEDVLAGLSTSVEAQVGRHLHDGWNQLGEEFEDYDAAQRAHEAQLSEVAQELDDWSTEAVAELLAARLAADRRAFEVGSGFPGPFLRVLFARRADVATSACTSVANDPAGPLCETVTEAVIALLEVDRPRASEHIRRLADCADPLVDRQLAAALVRTQQDQQSVSDSDRAVLLSLAASTDPSTREQVARGARSLARLDPGLAVQILLVIDVDDSPRAAEMVFGAFAHRHGYLNWLDLPETARTMLVDRLVRTPSLEEHQLMVFLSERSAEDPDSTLRLLLQRIERSVSEGAEYRPLPFRWHQPLQFRSTPMFGSVLRTIRDYVAMSPEAWQRASYGADLFRAAAQHFDDEVLQVLEDGVASADRDQVSAVGALLSEAPRTLVWDRQDVVTRLLRSADVVDPEAADCLRSGLFSAVMSGGRTGTPGKPFPEDVEQRGRSHQIAQRLPFGSVERGFYEALRASAESAIEWARRDDAHRDGRRW